MAETGVTEEEAAQKLETKNGGGDSQRGREIGRGDPDRTGSHRDLDTGIRFGRDNNF